MRSASILLATLASVATLAVVATGFQAKPLAPRKLPCVGEDCITIHRSVLVGERKKKRQWREYAGRILVKLNREQARWRPTVDYAITLASLVYGVPRSQMDAVAWCESRKDPFAVNGKYRGIFQLGWSPLGLSPFDPIANALSAAQTVRHDGSWRQWECKP